MKTKLETNSFSQEVHASAKRAKANIDNRKEAIAFIRKVQATRPLKPPGK